MKNYIFVLFICVSYLTIGIVIAKKQKSLSLFKAVFQKNHQELSRALEKGDNINGFNEFDQTPLMIAAKYGNLDMVKTLILMYNADVTIINKAGLNATLFAIANLDPRVLIFLLDYQTNTFLKVPLLQPLHSFINQYSCIRLKNAFQKWLNLIKKKEV